MSAGNPTLPGTHPHPDAHMRAMWDEGTERGERMLAFVRAVLPRPSHPTRVLEIGIGGGGIARVFRRHASVVGTDYSADRLRLVASRQGDQPFPLVCLDAVYLPFAAGAFDFVLLNGVLEYLGCRTGQTPRHHQRRALQDIRRVLRPGGTLYLAIENRWYPWHLRRDPHTGQPLVAMLPRRLASVYSTWRDRRPYQTWMYSLRALRRLVAESGFTELSVFVPVPSYQFPREYIAFGPRRRLLTDLPPSEPFARATALSWRGRAWFSAVERLALPQIAPSFVLLCR